VVLNGGVLNGGVLNGGAGRREVGGEQVGEYHRTGQVGRFLVADDPSPTGSADYRLAGCRPAAHLPLPFLTSLSCS
jgi:hypothetical protein